MTGHKKLLLAAVAIVALAVPAVANAVSEHANTEQFPPGYLQINPTTCKFLHKEIDQPTGPTWKNLRQFAIWRTLATTPSSTVSPTAPTTPPDWPATCR